MSTMTATTLDARASAVQRLVAEQAADWYVANREGLDAPRAAAFADWLKASPLHVQEYLCIAQLAGDLRTAAGNPATSIEALVEGARNAPDTLESLNGPFGEGVAPFPDLGRPARAGGEPQGQAQAQVAWMRVAATVCAVSLVGLLAVRWLAPGSDVLHRETAHGQHLSHSLPDQSLLTLDADSAVDIRYGKSERHIELVRGQALFQVAHDIARPFRVQAGAVAVTAVGTRFDVDRRADITVVTVLEGTVAVDVARDGAARVMVHAGQQLRIDSELVATGPLAVDASHSAAWLDGQIYFDQEPLAEVAAEVSRYSPQPIEVRDATLRGLPISGACAANDTDAFLAFVRSLDGVHVRSEPGSVVVEPR